jgi:hypothetical protein
MVRTEPTADGGSRELHPMHCPNGHPLKAETVLLGGDVERRTYLCRVCGLQIEIDHRTNVMTVVKRLPT